MTDEGRLSPPGLKPSEVAFIREIREFWKRNCDKTPYDGWSLYLLRNPVPSGIALYGEGGRFYPDFILWLKNGTSGETVVRFVEPHGFHDDSLAMVRNKAQCIEHLTLLNAQANFRANKVRVEGWLLSATTDLKQIPWVDHRGWAELEREFHILPMHRRYIDQVLALP